MFRRTSAAIVTTALVTSGLVLGVSQSAVAYTRSTWIASAPKDVNEGARVAIGVQVASPRKATKLRLQERRQDALGNYSWTTIRSRAVKGVARHTFKVVVAAENVGKYRSQVSYRTGRIASSKVATVRVWRWIPLVNLRSYYETHGVLANPYRSFNINGNQYLGWESYGSYPSWESRYTPGRHCKAFNGLLGVTDDSADGSTASISFGTDADETIYTSPPLSPGMQIRVKLPMKLPYRFIIRARSTSASGIAVYPAIGDPAFLCTGV
jgi:hypothetical protein